MGKNEISVSWLYVSLPCLQLILNSYGLVTQSNELLSLQKQSVFFFPPKDLIDSMFFVFFCLKPSNLMKQENATK